MRVWGTVTSLQLCLLLAMVGHGDLFSPMPDEKIFLSLGTWSIRRPFPETGLSNPQTPNPTPFFLFSDSWRYRNYVGFKAIEGVCIAEDKGNLIKKNRIMSQSS
jgi:hypothetical protein